MVTAEEIRKGLGAIPGTVGEYGLKGGLRRWSGLVYNRLRTDISGQSIFAEDWDVCIILDACRADELRNQRTEYDWIDSVSEFPSLASCTWNWLPRTLETAPDDALAETTYVSGNPFAGELCDPDRFYELDEVYTYAWNDDRGTVYPRPVTDRAIYHWRESGPSRLLVHYVQPHVPFLSDSADELSRSNFTHEERSIPDAWDRVTSGDLPRSEAISQYRDTLVRVLDDVTLFLSSIDADRVVVTADHGEAFGEWGLYGHPPNIGLPCLTQVPWVETTATDESSYVPDDYDTERQDVDKIEQLEALGYA